MRGTREPVGAVLRAAGLAAVMGSLTMCAATPDPEPAEEPQEPAAAEPAAEPPAEPELPDFDKLWDFKHPDQTEAKFRALLPQAEASGDAEYRLQLLTQIARTEGLQTRFDDAHGTLDGVEAQLSDATPIARCRYLLERGRAVNSGGDPKASVPLFEEAWERSRAAGSDKYAIDAAHMLGIVCEPDDSLAWSEKGMEVARETTDASQRGWLGVFYNNVGHGYLSRGDAETALTYFRKNEEFQQGRKSAYWKGVSRWCVARALRDLKRYDEALAIQRELEADYPAEIGYVYEEIGENLHAQGKPDEARPYFAKAYAQLSQQKWLEEAEPARLARLKDLGGVTD